MCNAHFHSRIYTRNGEREVCVFSLYVYNLSPFSNLHLSNLTIFYLALLLDAVLLICIHRSNNFIICATCSSSEWNLCAYARRQCNDLQFSASCIFVWALARCLCAEDCKHTRALGNTNRANQLSRLNAAVNYIWWHRVERTSETRLQQ